MNPLHPLYLAHRFHEGKVTTKEQVTYLSVALFLLTLGVFTIPPVPGVGPGSPSWVLANPSLFLLIANLLCLFIPLAMFLKGNNQGDGKDPIQRFFMLGFDAFVRYGLFIAILILIASTIAGAVNPNFYAWLNQDDVSFWASHGILLVGMLLVSLQLYLSGRVASGAKK